MADDLRKWVAEWLPAVCGPFGLARGADQLVSRLNEQNLATGLLRELRRSLPSQYGHAALLHPERAIVPFGFRDDALKKLRGWCEDRSAGTLSWKLLVGDTGRGKTRLVMKLVEDLQAPDGRNWQSGFVDLTRFSQNPEQVMCFARLPRDLVLVVDYAERFREAVVSLALATLALNELDQDRIIRLILISRRESDLWAETGIGRDDRRVGEFLAGGGMTTMVLPPIADQESLRAEIFTKAFDAFGEFHKNPKKMAGMPDLSAPEFQEALLIHAAALFTYLGELQPGPIKRDQILELILERERRLWNDMVEGKALGGELQNAPMEQAAAFLTFICLNEGVTSRDRAMDLLANCPRLSGVDGPKRGAVADIFHELYPGPGWVNGITPDLIGTYLLSITDLDFIADGLNSTD